eukprot:6141723-Prymnesium_polylepis.1
MDGELLQRYVPATLQPVRTGSHPRVGSCVTARVACAAGGSTVDMSSTSCACEGVPRHVSTPVLCSHSTDRQVLARAAGSSTAPTGIDRSITSNAPSVALINVHLSK